jgi:hypothetical protein
MRPFPNIRFALKTASPQPAWRYSVAVALAACGYSRKRRSWDPIYGTFTGGIDAVGRGTKFV